jgi:hypothetical protein
MECIINFFYHIKNFIYIVFIDKQIITDKPYDFDNDVVLISVV